jgi:TDG/mug DNA glycosylase family protein
MGPARHQGRRLSDTLPVLPDILEPGLDSVFCGSAAGTVSARKGSYYAGPGNKFWPTLHAMGLTPRLLKPEEFRTLPDYGLGLTDMTKHASGSDASLPKDSDDPEALRGKIERYRPRLLAFVGKRAAQVWFSHFHGNAQVAYGLQEETAGETALFVLPSPSGLAVRYWDEAPWRELAAMVRGL